LRITIVPATPIFEGGQKVGDKQGKYAKFENGHFETDDKDMIKKLENLDTFGVDFWRAGDKDKETKNDKSNQNTAPEQSPSENPDAQNQDQEVKLENLTKKELILMAKEKDVQVNEKQTKEEIINLLKEKDNK
jgi:hypothetical protein